MIYKSIPVSEKPYFDTHIHSVSHGDSFMANFTIRDVFKLIDSAQKIGLNKLCLTEHFPLPDISFDPTAAKDCSLSFNRFKTVLVDQRDKIKAYAKKYGIKILIGGEIDYFPGQRKYYQQAYSELKLEFKVLGIHFIDTIEVEPDENGYDCFDEKIDEPQTKQFCFDYSEKAFAEAVKQKGNKYIINRYFELLKEALSNNDYDTVAHLDLINKWNTSNKYFTEDETYNNQIKEVLELIKSKNIALEINLAGSNFTKQLFPKQWILKEAYQKGIPITIGSDTHTGNNLDINQWNFVYDQLEQTEIKNIFTPDYY